MPSSTTRGRGVHHGQGRRGGSRGGHGGRGGRGKRSQNSQRPHPAVYAQPPKQVLEQRLASRAAARQIVATAKKLEADKLFKQAVQYLRAGEPAKALKLLEEACKTYKTTQEYAGRMVQALFGVEKYNEVIPLASWIIAINPATTETRYLRAVAFQAQKMYANASADYKKCLEQDKTMTKCIQALDQLDDLWDAEDDDEWSDMSPCTAMHDLECASDSEDSRHDGNGTPCTMYNHDGCKYEIQCRFKHSADSRSVRDNLGQNVCLFWLIGRCYFVNKARPCWYSHSKKDLPANGWWNNGEYIEFYRDFYDTFKPISDDQTLDKVMGRDMNGQWHPWEQASKLAEAFEEFDSLQHQNTLLQRDLEHLIDDVRGRPHRVFRNNKPHSRLYYENSKVGFTRQDVMELAMQGVMPWEDDAADVLAVLNGHYQ